MALLGAKQFVKPSFHTNEGTSVKKTFWLLLLVALVMGGTAYHYAPAIPFLLLPILFFKKQDMRWLAALGSVLIFKIALSIILEPAEAYQAYAFDPIWLAREVGSVFLFYAWILLGQRVLTAHKMLELSGMAYGILTVTLYAVLFFFSGSYVVSGINNLIIFLYMIFYILIIGDGMRVWRWLSAGAILLTALLPMQSSFTVISSVMLIAMALGMELRLLQRQIIWRRIAVLGIGVLLVMSMFAYLVHVRETRETGEGNNGFTRATLALAGYNQLKTEPLIGSPMGRGILPMRVVQDFGWWQYFSGDEAFNIYALSFHNSFIYLLSRFGALSLLLFWLFLGRIPRSGPLHAVLFTLILLLGSGANVVIESLRAGPAVGLALGMIISLGQKKNE